jgi:hypothetical protein
MRSSEKVPSKTYAHKARCCEASDTGNNTFVALGKEYLTTLAIVFYSAKKSLPAEVLW